MRARLPRWAAITAGTAGLVVTGGCTGSRPPAAGEDTDSVTRVRAAREVLFYTGGSGAEAIDDFRAHADRISIISPQAFRVDSLGNVAGAVHPELLEIAAANSVRVIPLIVNPGFDQGTMHALLRSPVARRRTIDAFIELAHRDGFDGWQFDYENFHVDVRDAFSAYFRETAAALHEAGLTLSVAIVPTGGGAGATSFQRYMQDNWRNGFDIAALAGAGDFVSLMTYAQHGGPTAPGPIAGLPWVREMLDYALAQGVPAEKISLGVPTYSGWWQPVHDETLGARVAGREIPYSRAAELIAGNAPALSWLPEIGVHYAFWANDGIYEWLFLEDARSLDAKLDLFDSYPGLRGISAWVLGAEDPAIWSVLAERMPAGR